jgi:hypothetical protein
MLHHPPQTRPGQELRLPRVTPPHGLDATRRLWTRSARLARSSPDSMPVPDPVRGVTSRRLLLAPGWTTTSLRRELRSGRLVALGRGAYAPAALLAAAAREPNLAHAGDIAAIAATQRRPVAASHLTAAGLHRLDVLHPPDRLEFTTARGIDKVRRDYRIRVAALPRDHLDIRRGVSVTTVARTVIDVARTRPLREALVVADSALRTVERSRRWRRWADC